MKKLAALMLSFLLLTGCSGREQNAEADKESIQSIHREGVVVALLDTGVSTTAVQSENLLPGWNYVTENDDTEDRINHGTAVTSVILGSESAGVDALAPHVHVVPLVITDKVNGTAESVSPDVLGKAIRDSVDLYGASIINISFGIKKDAPDLRNAIAYVHEKGALVIAASGNGGDSTDIYYPAAYEEVLTVGSHDKHLKVSDFTQQNGTVDILAPGEDIWLASRNGKTYGARGTSYAAAYVTAVAAMIWKNNSSMSADEVREQILSGAATVDGWKILDLTPFEKLE